MCGWVAWTHLLLTFLSRWCVGQLKFTADAHAVCGHRKPTPILARNAGQTDTNDREVRVVGPYFFSREDTDRYKWCQTTSIVWELQSPEDFWISLRKVREVHTCYANSQKWYWSIVANQVGPWQVRAMQIPPWVQITRIICGFAPCRLPRVFKHNDKNYFNGILSRNIPLWFSEGPKTASLGSHTMSGENVMLLDQQPHLTLLALRVVRSFSFLLIWHNYFSQYVMLFGTIVIHKNDYTHGYN
jgi:hypothetical protein